MVIVFEVRSPDISPAAESLAPQSKGRNCTGTPEKARDAGGAQQ